MNWLINQSQQRGNNTEKPKDSRIRLCSFSGLPTEDVLAWLDHFDNVADYHQRSDDRKSLELRKILENVATTWFIQQLEEVKQDWSYIHKQLVQHFVNNDITRTTLQQLGNMHQQTHEPVA